MAGERGGTQAEASGTAWALGEPREVDEALSYSDTFPRLVAVARSCGLGLDDALEVAQDAFVELWLKRPPAIHTEAWLVCLVGRRSIDRLRRERLRPAVEGRSACSVRVNSGRACEVRAEARRALDRLPPRLRALVRFRYLMDLAPEEAARRAGYAEKSGRKLLARTLARLRRELGVAQ